MREDMTVQFKSPKFCVEEERLFTLCSRFSFRHDEKVTVYCLMDIHRALGGKEE